MSVRRFEHDFHKLIFKIKHKLFVPYGSCLLQRKVLGAAMQLRTFPDFLITAVRGLYAELYRLYEVYKLKYAFKICTRTKQLLYT